MHTTRNGGWVAWWIAATMLVGLWLLPPPPALHAREDPTVTRKLLDNATVLNTAVSIGSAYLPYCRATAIYVDWTTAVASGVVTVETAVDQNYTGTWAPLAAVTFSGTAPKQDVVQMTGTAWAIRTRISTVVAGGGAVNTWVVCN